jgi:hypothetical protein
VAHNSAKNSAKPLLETWSWTERAFEFPSAEPALPTQTRSGSVTKRFNLGQFLGCGRVAAA